MVTKKNDDEQPNTEYDYNDTTHWAVQDAEKLVTEFCNISGAANRLTINDGVLLRTVIIDALEKNANENFDSGYEDGVSEERSKGNKK